MKDSLPEDFKQLWFDVQLCRTLNRMTGSTQYTPHNIRQLTVEEAEYFTIIARWQNG